MPRYDYNCSECGGVFEATHSMSDEPVKQCELCGNSSVKRLISAPMLNTIKSGSPTGAKYEKMADKEVQNMEDEPIAEMEKDEEMAQTLRIMRSGAID